jgi:hypothetical protein
MNSPLSSINDRTGKLISWLASQLRFTLVFGILLLAVLTSEALATPTVADSSFAHALPRDQSMPLIMRRPDAARLRELAGQSEFRYVEADESAGFWAAFWAWLWRWLERLMGVLSNTPTGRLSWKYGTYAALAAILTFAVLKLLQVDLTGVFGRGPRRSRLAYDIEGENIHEVDFRARIAEAEAAGNLRLATRLGYLEVLKFLTDQDLINWQPDKTNQAYLQELATSPLRERFREATRQFEYVWYGELSLNAALYQQVRTGQQAITRAAAGRPATFANSTPA